MDENFDIFAGVNEMCKSDFRSGIETAIIASGDVLENPNELFPESHVDLKKASKRKGKMEKLVTASKEAKLEMSSTVKELANSVEKESQNSKGRATRRSTRLNESLEKMETASKSSSKEFASEDFDTETAIGGKRGRGGTRGSRATRSTRGAYASRGSGKSRGRGRSSQKIDAVERESSVESRNSFESTISATDAVSYGNKSLEVNESSVSETTSRTRQNRRCVSDRAARASNVDYVDLVSSPAPIVFISIDSEDEDANKVPIFTNMTIKNTTTSLDMSFDDENPEVSVKIKWGSEIEIFLMRKYQKFATVLKKLAERNNVSEDQIMLNLENKILSPDDTVDSIKYKVYQFISGRAVKESVMPSFANCGKTFKKQEKDQNLIKLKVQSDKRKHPFIFHISKTDKLKMLYIKCAEELNEPIGNFQLSFDGDDLDMQNTPIDLELEGGEVIDLRFKNQNQK